MREGGGNGVRKDDGASDGAEHHPRASSLRGAFPCAFDGTESFGQIRCHRIYIPVAPKPNR